MSRLNLSERQNIFIEGFAKEHYGGHFTILNFTTEIKFSFGTVTDRDEINDLHGYDNLSDAVENAIQVAILSKKRKEGEINFLTKKAEILNEFTDIEIADLQLICVEYYNEFIRPRINKKKEVDDE